MLRKHSRAGGDGDMMLQMRAGFMMEQQIKAGDVLVVTPKGDARVIVQLWHAGSHEAQAFREHEAAAPATRQPIRQSSAAAAAAAGAVEQGCGSEERGSETDEVSEEEESDDEEEKNGGWQSSDSSSASEDGRRPARARGGRKQLGPALPPAAAAAAAAQERQRQQRTSRFVEYPEGSGQYCIAVPRRTMVNGDLYLPGWMLEAGCPEMPAGSQTGHLRAVQAGRGGQTWDLKYNTYRDKTVLWIPTAFKSHHRVREGDVLVLRSSGTGSVTYRLWGQGSAEAQEYRAFEREAPLMKARKVVARTSDGRADGGIGLSSPPGASTPAKRKVGVSEGRLHGDKRHRGTEVPEVQLQEYQQQKLQKQRAEQERQAGQGLVAPSGQQRQDTPRQPLQHSAPSSPRKVGKFVSSWLQLQDGCFSLTLTSPMLRRKSFTINTSQAVAIFGCRPGSHLPPAGVTLRTPANGGQYECVLKRYVENEPNTWYLHAADLLAGLPAAENDQLHFWPAGTGAAMVTLARTSAAAQRAAQPAQVDKPSSGTQEKQQQQQQQQQQQHMPQSPASVPSPLPQQPQHMASTAPISPPTRSPVATSTCAGGSASAGTAGTAQGPAAELAAAGSREGNVLAQLLDCLETEGGIPKAAVDAFSRLLLTLPTEEQRQHYTVLQGMASLRMWPAAKDWLCRSHA